MNKGFWVTFEGGEGSGKTTVINALEKKLISEGRDVLVTREPGGVPIGEKIRELILSFDSEGMDARTEALLFAASRRQHLVDKVIPALERGTIIIMDRYVDSSLAYQGYARGIGVEEVLSLNHFATEGYQPDLVIFIDVVPELGLSRIEQDHREYNRLDAESMNFHHEVRKGYLELAKNKRRMTIIDGDVSIDQLIDEVITLVSVHLHHYEEALHG